MPNGLKNLRKRAGLTQEQAAKAMALSKSGYIKIESGRRELSARHIQAAMTAFSATEREILTSSAAAASLGPLANPEDYQRLKEACVAFLEAFSDSQGADQWIAELEAAILQPETGSLPESRDEIRQIARGIAKSARFRVMQEKRKALKNHK